MTTERNGEPMDELVSSTYQEHSAERAPEHLNRKILSMAAAANSAKRRNGVLPKTWAKTWTIPLAWAATVGISLAIVLEVTQIPGEHPDVSTPAVESLHEEFEPRNADLLEDARDHAARQSGSNREDLFNAKPYKEPETAARQKTAPTIAEADKFVVLRNNAEPEFERKEKSVAPASVASESAPSPARPFAALQGLADSSPVDSCNAASRETAKTWQACIEDLRQSGFAEDADREYRAFALEFPAESGALDRKK